MSSIENIICSQREFFKSGQTLDVEFRRENLKRLYSAVRKYENEINAALKADLGKSGFESFMCESGLVLTELSYMIKHVKWLSRNRRVRTPLSQFCSKSYVKVCPYGNTLIMSPWNYPFLLTVAPLAATIAAGNTAIIKPSAYSGATSAIIQKIISECFEESYVAVITGGRKENSELLKQKFDFVFFTGSQEVGKEVLRNTAEHLTPAVLELGGKSPCIVDNTANISLAAKRIVFGKFLNCGQTCVAPDFILCQKDVKDELVSQIIKQIKQQYGEDTLQNSNYGKIINEKHFERLCSLIDGDKVLYGAQTDAKALKISPTVMDNVLWSDKIMSEEIFGPILPVITYENFSQVFELLENRAKPLALYLFSEDKKHIKDASERLRYGGGCINDTVIHLATTEMGFGGVGESGMGAYHGKVGFDTFSHHKSIVDKKTWIDLPIRYSPYKKGIKTFLLRLFLR